jgi:hypothetical protein
MSLPQVNQTDLQHAILVLSNAPLTYTVTTSDEVEYVTEPAISIATVRLITTSAHQRPGTGSQKLLVLRTLSLSVESQNALLKLLEEPPDSTRIYVVLPPECYVLPTVLSRVQQRIDTNQVEIDSTPWQLFIDLPLADKLATIDQKLKAKDAAWQLSIKQGYLSWVKSNSHVSSLIVLIAEKLLTRGAGNKMLFEAMALEMHSKK